MKKLDELQLEDKKYIIFDMDGTLIDSMACGIEQIKN